MTQFGQIDGQALIGVSVGLFAAGGSVVTESWSACCSSSTRDQRMPIAYIDDVAGMPLVTNGGDIEVDIAAPRIVRI